MERRIHKQWRHSKSRLNFSLRATEIFRKNFAELAIARFLFQYFIHRMSREIDAELASFFREKEPINLHLNIMVQEISQTNSL